MGNIRAQSAFMNCHPRSDPLNAELSRPKARLLVSVAGSEHPHGSVIRALVWRPELNGDRDQMTVVPANDTRHPS